MARMSEMIERGRTHFRQSPVVVFLKSHRTSLLWVTGLLAAVKGALVGWGTVGSRGPQVVGPLMGAGIGVGVVIAWAHYHPSTPALAGSPPEMVDAPPPRGPDAA